MKILVSAILLLVPFIVYFTIIRPKLEFGWTEIYRDIDGVLPRLWTRLVAFKTFFLTSVAIWLTEAPALLVELQYIDTSSWPTHWQSTFRIGMVVLIMVIKSFDTKPGEEK